MFSNFEGDPLLRDSILSNFKGFFNEKYSFSDKAFFDEFFFEDSLLQYDFYKEDFFSDRFLRNMERMEELFREMDSVKNSFFSRQLE